PRNLNLESLHPDIVQRRAPLLFPRVLTPWPRGPRPRVAGVSAFGVAGTNAHVILSEAPAPAPSGDQSLGRHALVVLSGQTDQAAWDHALRMHESLAKDPSASLQDLALTSTCGRSHLPSRVAVCVASPAELEQRLGEFLWGRAAPGLFSGRAPSTPARVGFLFGGESAELTSAGHALYERHATLRAALDRLSDAARQWVGAPVSQVLWGGAPEQPWSGAAMAASQLALELALAELWKSAGMIPDFAAGYGSGEYAAACVAGVLSPSDALQLVAERARLWSEHAPDRAALRVYAAESRVRPLLEGAELTLTADEGYTCVIAGRKEGLEAFARALREKHLSSNPCQGPWAATGNAAGMAEAMALLASRVRLRPPLLRLFSGATGAELPPGEAPRPSYWAEHTRGPVRLAAMVRAMEERGCEVFVEVAPDGALSQRQAAVSRSLWIPTLARGRADDEVFLSAMANLFVRGAIVDVRALGRPPPTRVSAPPTYPFQRKRYWLDPETPQNGAEPARVRRDMVQELSQVAERERLPLLRRYLASEIARVLGWESASSLREDVLLSEVGLDSILAMDLLGVLRRDLSLQLPAALFYDYPTLATLLGYLERVLLPQVAASAGPNGAANGSGGSGVTSPAGSAPPEL
ncbi:MAG TPA: acyltransferase domain-containing protein, partial [Myxococcales bacterium]|nr:acyltransferase domain-containing protein [Myxococcales bacterium]